MERIVALREFCSDFYGKKLALKVTEAQFDQVVAFIQDHDHLGHLEFEYAVNRMYLDKPKPKGWTEVMEMLLSANTRAKGVRK